MQLKYRMRITQLFALLPPCVLGTVLATGTAGKKRLQPISQYFAGVHRVHPPAALVCRSGAATATVVLGMYALDDFTPACDSSRSTVAPALQLYRSPQLRGSGCYVVKTGLVLLRTSGEQRGKEFGPAIIVHLAGRTINKRKWAFSLTDMQHTAHWPTRVR